MSAMTDYLENKSLDHCLGTTTYTKPTGTYVALHTADPTDVGNVGELSTVGTGYARQSTAWTAASGGVARNVAQLQYGPALTAWGTVTHFTVWDAATGGNCLYHAVFDAPRTYAVGDVAIHLANDLAVSHA